MSARPFIPNVSANESNVEICSSNTLTSPEYMKVNSATIDPKLAPGITITGWNGGSKVRNNSEKNELHALSTTRWARTVRPSADSVTSVKCDWSNSNGNDVNRLVYVCKWNWIWIFTKNFNKINLTYHKHSIDDALKKKTLNCLNMMRSSFIFN